MPTENKHIDIERLRRYLNDQMSSNERNALEKEALSNPLLAEAIDGYENNPGSFNSFQNKHKKELSGGRDYTFIIGLSVLGLFFIAAYLIDFEDTRNRITMIKEKSIHKELYVAHTLMEDDFEQIPLKIDTLPVINIHDIIPLDELIEKQASGKPTNDEKNDIIVNETIKIEESTSIEEDYHYVSEEKYRLGQNSLETVYMADLMVVDYRVIQRSNKKIHYTRLELTGLSAASEHENESSEQMSTTEVEVPYVNYLRQSMTYFAKGNYKKALTRYETILEQYNSDINAHFYGGLCLYNLGQYEETIEYLNILLKDKYHVFDQEAAWYKAKALIQVGRVDEAKIILETIIAQGGFYSTKAIELNKSI